LRTKFETREHNIKEPENVTFIVGFCPGTQRKKDANKQVFHGNKTGDLVEKLIKGKQNIYLTNVFNVYLKEEKITSTIVKEGAEELRDDVVKYKPVKVIALGTVAADTVEKISNEKGMHKFKLVKLRHPSFVMRFKKGVKEYEEEFKKELE
jgi:hypothetical protein